MYRYVATRTLQLLAAMVLGLGLAACSDDAENAGSTTVSAGADDTTTTVSAGADETTTTVSTVEETSTTSVDDNSTTTQAEQQDQSILVVSGTGLVVTNVETGDSVTLAFGADRSEVIDAISSALAAVPTESDGSAECPNFQAKVATWPDLILDFDATDRFLSWRLPVGSQLTDADGLALGSSRSELNSAQLASIEESSLGTEFGMKGSVAGLLSGPEEDATVVVLWAGELCTFR